MKLEVIIAPLVVFFLMVILLIAARFYDRSPIQAPACGFKKFTGIPCVACRGTRSFQALARGDIKQAIKFNPLAVLSCLIGLVWIGGYVVRKGREPSHRIPLKLVAIFTTLLVIGNWIYLIATEGLIP